MWQLIGVFVLGVWAGLLLMGSLCASSLALTDRRDAADELERHRTAREQALRAPDELEQP